MLNFVYGENAYVTEATDLIDTVVADLGDVLFSALTTVLGIVAVLIALFFAIRLIRKWIGRGK